ncbi:N-acetylmuramoyl-L-alanine amidase family protein, partial [Bacillus mycoides]|uniref:N-acetylmuramoyl-L-alanine amidase family protein n=1 Tax=Bacillus mycoides TaxID=1405 RepID=UPI003810C3DB
YYFGKKDDGSKLVTGQTVAEGEMATGWFYVGKDKYLAKNDGSLELDTHDGGSYRYFFDKTTGTCLFVTGKRENKDYGYSDDSSNDKRIHGFYDHNGKTYYFGKSGDKLLDGSKLAEGQMATGWFQVGNDWYRAETDGKLNVGILDWHGGDKYFFDKTVGKHVFSIKKSEDKYYGYGPGKDATLLHGFYEFDGKKYYFGKKDDGSGLAEGQMATGSRMIDGKAHYFNNDGIEEEHEFAGFQTINGKKYYFGKKDDGSGLGEGQMATYFVRINSKLRYFGNDGITWGENSWLPDYNQPGEPNTWYIFGEGELATGFQAINGKKYYFGKKDDGSGLGEGQMATNWFKIGEVQYAAES